MGSQGAVSDPGLQLDGNMEVNSGPTTQGGVYSSPNTLDAGSTLGDRLQPKLINPDVSENSASSGSKSGPLSGSRPRRIGIELCCGSAGLTAELIEQGWEGIGVDYRNRRTPKAPTLSIDLTTGAGLQQLLRILDDVCVVYVHFGLPCGTFSRAREIAVPQRLLDAGAFAPEPLRSEDHPEGLPGWSSRPALRP